MHDHRLSCPCGDGTRPGHPPRWCGQGQRALSTDAPPSELKLPTMMQDFVDDIASQRDLPPSEPKLRTPSRNGDLEVGVPSDGDEGEQPFAQEVEEIRREYERFEDDRLTRPHPTWSDVGILLAALRRSTPPVPSEELRERIAAALYGAHADTIRGMGLTPYTWEALPNGDRSKWLSRAALLLSGTDREGETNG